MKDLASVSFLALLVLVQSKVAKDHKERENEVSVSEEHLKKSQRLLRTSELQEENPEFVDDNQAGRRNPIAWVKEKLKNTCACENLKCECCFTLKFFKKKACLGAEKLPGGQALNIVFKLDEKVLVNKTFSINRSIHVCGTVPPPLNTIKFCFAQHTEARPDNAISSCSSVNFTAFSSVGAVLQFRCLEFRGGKLTFGGYSKIKNEGVFTLNIKSPFKAFIAALYNKIKGKGKDEPKQHDKVDTTPVMVTKCDPSSATKCDPTSPSDVVTTEIDLNGE